MYANICIYPVLQQLDIADLLPQDDGNYISTVSSTFSQIFTNTYKWIHRPGLRDRLKKCVNRTENRSNGSTMFSTNTEQGSSFLYTRQSLSQLHFLDPCDLKFGTGKKTAESEPKKIPKLNSCKSAFLWKGSKYV